MIKYFYIFIFNSQIANCSNWLNIFTYFIWSCIFVLFSSSFYLCFFHLCLNLFIQMPPSSPFSSSLSLSLSLLSLSLSPHLLLAALVFLPTVPDKPTLTPPIFCPKTTTAPGIWNQWVQAIFSVSIFWMLASWSASTPSAALCAMPTCRFALNLPTLNFKSALGWIPLLSPILSAPPWKLAVVPNRALNKKKLILFYE